MRYITLTPSKTLINKHIKGRKSCLTSASKLKSLWKAIAAIGISLKPPCLLISGNDERHLTHKQDLSGGQLTKPPPYFIVDTSVGDPPAP